MTRFEEIAERKRWTETKKLGEILPRLHGIAGDYVFGQLKNAKSYGVKFRYRNQNAGETVEDYVADLKCL